MTLTAQLTVSLIGSRALAQLHPDSIGIMRLLNSHGSNPMKHLIPYLHDDQKAADYLRQLRWPNGVMCPRCGSGAVESRERGDNGLQRFNCVPCAVRVGQQCAMCTDWTHSIFEESKLRPLDWLLVIGLWQWKLKSATRVRAAQGCPVTSNAATVHPDHAGCSCAVAPPLRRAVHPYWVWCNAATRQTRTHQPHKSLSKCSRTCAPRRSNPSLPPG